MRRADIMFTGIVLLILSLFAAAQERPLILISNDDGYSTEGIRALAAEFQKLGTVIVVAPRTNASGVGHGITYRTPVFYGEAQKIGDAPVWWVDALPATCVRWALDTRFEGKRPDLIVSGINRGENIGWAVYYSGTLGAAREGAFEGIPAIAVSMAARGNDWAGGAAVARRIAEQYLDMAQKPALLNINLPEGMLTEATPVQVTTLATVRFPTSYDNRVSPRDGLSYYWTIIGDPDTAPAGTDLHALQQGAVSVTPLIVDATDRSAMSALAGFEKK
jgi:5'-nucleotidase